MVAEKGQPHPLSTTSNRQRFTGMASSPMDNRAERETCVRVGVEPNRYLLRHVKFNAGQKSNPMWVTPHVRGFAYD